MSNFEMITQAMSESPDSTFTVVFTKKDGSDREMTFTPSVVGEIKGTGQSNTKDDLITVFEQSKEQWRSFYAESVTSFKVHII